MKKALLVFLCLMMTFLLFPNCTLAAGLALNIDGPSSVKALEEFTVTLTVDGTGVTELRGTIKLDENLTLAQSTSPLLSPWQMDVQVLDQTLSFTLTDPTGQSSINAQTDILTLTLTARSVGEARISVDELVGTDADGSFTASAASYKATVNKSQNTQLASLSADKGTLTPAFSPGVLSYTLTVPGDATQVSLFAAAQDKNSIISGAGVTAFTEQQKTVNIVITAQDNSTSTVAVIIKRAVLASQATTQEPQATAPTGVTSDSGKALITVVLLFAGCLIGVSLIVLGLIRQRQKR